jgi:hypothetical protein
LDLVVKKGQILYIPAYWWYSIEFGNEASLVMFKYKTYMNTIAILPQLIMKLLQTQNVKRNHVNRVDMREEQIITSTIEPTNIIEPVLAANPLPEPFA